MKKLLTLIIAFCFTNIVTSQEVDIDKSTGLVKVDNKESFYLIKTNKTFLTTDFSLQNLNKEELAYLKSTDVNTLPWNERGNYKGMFLKMTFIATTNTVNVFPDAFDGIKQLAKRLAKAKLVVDNQIDPKAERLFVVSNNGKIFKEPAPMQVIINNSTPNNNSATVSSNISIKANNIYNNDEFVGSFKKSVDSLTNTTTVNVYNKDGARVVVAKRQGNIADADWDVVIVATNKNNQVLYNANNPMEKLFKYLVDKGFL